MLLFVSDENFNNDILRGLLRREPSLDIIRVQDVGMSNTPDPDILEWAAEQKKTSAHTRPEHDCQIRL